MRTGRVEPADNTVMERKAADVAKAYGEHFGSSGYGAQPEVFPGAHEGSFAPFVVSWEEGPFQWTYDLELSHQIGRAHGVYLEPVNHFALAVYPQ